MDDLGVVDVRKIGDGYRGIMEGTREHGSWSNFIISLLLDRMIGRVLGSKRCL